LEGGPAADQLDLEARGAFAATLGVPELREVETTGLPDQYPYSWRVALHPDGEALAIGTPEKPVRWVHGLPLQLPKNLDPEQERPWLWYSPDGRYLLFAPATGGLEVWDAAVRHIQKKLDLPGVRPVLAVGFDRAEKTLWACQDDGQVCSWSVPDWKPGARRPIDFPVLQIQAAAFNADATRLAVGDRAGKVQLFQSDGKWLRDLAAEQRPRVGALACSPDSLLVAIGTQDGNVEVWQADGFRVHQFSAFATDVGALVFHPDGRLLLAGERHGNMKMWELATGAQVLTGDPAPWGFARDGRRLAGSQYDKAGFWDLTVPQVVRQLTGHRAPIVQTFWCRDGQHLATIDSGFAVREPGSRRFG
jgi:WD40 repeat protein